jgi:hypothetical protein
VQSGKKNTFRVEETDAFRCGVEDQAERGKEAVHCSSLDRGTAGRRECSGEGDKHGNETSKYPYQMSH